MEIKRKQKTLAGLFLKFAVLFSVNTVLIFVGCMLFLIGSSFLGVTLPANYAEIHLTKHTSEIRAAGESPEKWMPKGCIYGIYDAEGKWKSGTFPAEEQEEAWLHYKEENIYAQKSSYYRFISQDSGDICIVKYDLYMKYANDTWNDILPTPEVMSFIIDGILFALNAVFLSGRFAKRLNRELGKLRGITDRIAENNLEFVTKPSDIREIGEVMTSLSQMKEALKDSLTVQWEMEQQKQEQLAALAHDIKTPLTIIKGNAELLAEDELSAESKECTDYILSNVSDIEQYLEHIKQVLYGSGPEHTVKVISCNHLGEMLQCAAVQIAAAEKMPVSFDIEADEGKVRCSPENIRRAWKNVLSNAAEHTNKERGIEVHVKRCRKEDQEYMAASVRDFGAGFSAKDLEYADQEFYSGDASRHDRKHQGLGLAIAKRFLEEQGGFLQFCNHTEQGAEVSCWIKMC